MLRINLLHNLRHSVIKSSLEKRIQHNPSIVEQELFNKILFKDTLHFNFIIIRANILKKANTGLLSDLLHLGISFSIYLNYSVVYLNFIKVYCFYLELINVVLSSIIKEISFLFVPTILWNKLSNLFHKWPFE